MFATIDDSLFYDRSFYVYSHALVVDDGLPQIIMFSGSKKEIYNHEKDLMEFLGSYVYEGCILYACRHYSMYEMLWKTFAPKQANDKKLSKIIREAYVSCHYAALTAAKCEFERHN